MKNCFYFQRAKRKSSTEAQRRSPDIFQTNVSSEDWNFEKAFLLLPVCCTSNLMRMEYIDVAELEKVLLKNTKLRRGCRGTVASKGTP